MQRRGRQGAVKADAHHSGHTQRQRAAADAGAKGPGISTDGRVGRGYASQRGSVLAWAKHEESSSRERRVERRRHASHMMALDKHQRTQDDMARARRRGQSDMGRVHHRRGQSDMARAHHRRGQSDMTRRRGQSDMTRRRGQSDMTRRRGQRSMSRGRGRGHDDTQRSEARRRSRSPPAPLSKPATQRERLNNTLALYGVPSSAVRVPPKHPLKGRRVASARRCRPTSKQLPADHPDARLDGRQTYMGAGASSRQSSGNGKRRPRPQSQRLARGTASRRRPRPASATLRGGVTDEDAQARLQHLLRPLQLASRSRGALFASSTARAKLSEQAMDSARSAPALPSASSSVTPQLQRSATDAPDATGANTARARVHGDGTTGDTGSSTRRDVNRRRKRPESAPRLRAQASAQHSSPPRSPPSRRGASAIPRSPSPLVSPPRPTVPGPSMPPPAAGVETEGSTAPPPLPTEDKWVEGVTGWLGVSLPQKPKPLHADTKLHNAAVASLQLSARLSAARIELAAMRASAEAVQAAKAAREADSTGSAPSITPRSGSARQARAATPTTTSLARNATRVVSVSKLGLSPSQQRLDRHRPAQASARRISPVSTATASPAASTRRTSPPHLPPGAARQVAAASARPKAAAPSSSGAAPPESSPIRAALEPIIRGLSTDFDAVTAKQRALLFSRALSQLEVLWVDLDVPHSDRDTFRKCYCFGLCTPEAAAAVAKHLRLLLEHQAARTQVLGHVAQRERCLEALNQELKGYLAPVSSGDRVTPASGRKQRVRKLLLSTVRQGVQVVESVGRWRATLWRPWPFRYQGVSYLAKMQTDTDFLFSADGARMLTGLSIASEEAALCSFPVALLSNRDDNMPAALQRHFARYPSMKRRVAAAAKELAAEQTRHMQLQLESQRLLAHGVYIPFLRWTPPQSQVRGVASDKGWVAGQGRRQGGNSGREDHSDERGDRGHGSWGGSGSAPRQGGRRKVTRRAMSVMRPTASTLAKRHDAPPDRADHRSGVMDGFRTLTPKVGTGNGGTTSAEAVRRAYQAAPPPPPATAR